MMSILDVVPYPWPDPLAQELHLTLCRLYPTPDDAVFLAQKVGVQRYDLDIQKKAYFIWHDILDEVARRARTKPLVAAVKDRLTAEQPEYRFISDLLEGIRPPVDAQPHESVDDTVSEAEALLYRDDLTLEIGRLPAFIATLQALVPLVPAVCRIEAGFAGDPGVGSGFRIGPDLVLTNWHVLHAKSGTDLTSVKLEFGFEDDGQGSGLASTAVMAEPASIVSNQADDWAVIRPTTSIDDRFTAVSLKDAADPIKGDAAYIIQHPLGGRKRLGFVRNQVIDFDDKSLRYLTDTQPGSSGSPVFNAAGRLIGLHRAGGVPQTVTGKVPMIKNHGIRIPRIVAGLKANGVSY